ncbi:tailspike protein 3 [Bacillus phage vB_BanH_McCartney]|nr:tailspike protein 3 [Bacillus phage vB_BanH_McCartney]
MERMKTMTGHNPMPRNTTYSNNPDVLEKIGELDLAVKKLEEGSGESGDYATKADIQGMVRQVNSTNPDGNGNVTLTGLVKKVNSTAPDANGNVTISIPNVSGMVKSVNGTAPDTNGNVTITIPSTSGFVKKVNNVAPDANGNVTLNVFTSGTTAQRPTTTTVGQYFFDTTLNKPLYRNAANNGWVDGTGAPVT